MRNDFCSNYLEHSAKGSTWSKGTKYIDKVWKNGKWVYQYKITGKGYKLDKQNHMEKANRSSHFAKEASNIGGDVAKREAISEARKSSYYGRKAAEDESNYYTKSLAGKTEKAVKRGTKKINSLLNNLKPKTTETVKDTFTGETKKVNRSGETINVKKAAEKNKKSTSNNGKTKITISSTITAKKKKKK